MEGESFSDDNDDAHNGNQRRDSLMKKNKIIINEAYKKEMQRKETDTAFVFVFLSEGPFRL
jgi:hypothetical protein